MDMAVQIRVLTRRKMIFRLTIIRLTKSAQPAYCTPRRSWTSQGRVTGAICGLKQDDIELLLRVLIFPLKTDGLSGQFLKFRYGCGLFIEDSLNYL